MVPGGHYHMVKSPYGQESLWFLWKLAPQSWAFNTVLPFRIKGDLDRKAFAQAFQSLTDRHPCLRCEFAELNGKPQQRFAARRVARIEETDASEWSDDRLDGVLLDHARQAFDLTVDASIRVCLFRESDDSHVALIDHIINDYWSMSVIMDDLEKLYAAARDGAEHSLPDLPLSFEFFVLWQRKLLSGEASKRHLDYWREELAGDLPTLDLPTDRRRSPTQSFRGGTVVRRIDSELNRKLAQLAASQKTTLFTVLLAAYQALLHRYSGQSEVMVGIPTSGRSRQELAGMVGDLVNMAPIRASLDESLTYQQLLKSTIAKVMGSIEHQDYPFSLVVEDLQPARDLSRSPIFQTTFVLQKLQRFPNLSRLILPADDEPSVPFADLTLEGIPLLQQDGQFDLNLEMKEDDLGRLVGAWKFSADLFEARTIEKMADNFETLLRGIVSNPDTPICQLPLLSPAAAESILVAGTGPNVDLPQASSVCEIFESFAAASGDAVALSADEQTLSYAELSKQVTKLALHLTSLGVGKDVLVGVVLPRGFDFVISLLAINKAGGAFLPIDPRHPSARIVKVLRSSGAPLVIDSPSLDRELSTAIESVVAEGRLRTVKVSDATAEIPNGVLPKVSGEDLAYVMFTSGSTGTPKGVMVEHWGMVNHVHAKLSDLEMDRSDVLAQNGPQSFDIVVWQCLAPLTRGGRVVIISDEIAEDPRGLLAAVQQEGITVLQLVPTMLRAVLDHVEQNPSERPTSLRWIVPTGDALPTELCRRWLQAFPDVPILNTYGSTECSDDQCHYKISTLNTADEAEAIASIGTPIHNMTAHVLDSNGVPVPDGVVGELFIGGRGVGRGYLDDSERTNKAFIPDSTSAPSDARLYKTNDMVRRRADGAISFLGRLDHMIKINGMRIEPGEIETTLCNHPAISEAVVVVRKHPTGGRRLVGYGSLLVAQSEPSTEELRDFVGQHQPTYMTPAVYCLMNELPQNSNGKIDRKQLPEPDWGREPEEEITPPQTPTQNNMERIWSEVLGVEQCSVTQDFFALGGDSIRSIQIVARCQHKGWRVTAADLFQRPTILELSAFVDSQARSSDTGSESKDEVSAPELTVDASDLAKALGQVQFENH